MTDDTVQLRQFVESGDEEAFRALVDRHFNLVYGTALRLTNGDSSLAQDVAQTVFSDLARKAGYLSQNVLLAGWLYQAARFSAAKAVRTEQRRKVRELEGIAMQNIQSESSPEWDQLRPMLDAAMAELNARDREAVLLHYFEQKSFRAIGLVLGLSDDAAQKRVSRALDKLRHIFGRSGIATSGASLSAFLSANALVAAPPGLASAVANVSLSLAVKLGRPSAARILLQRFIATKGSMVTAGLVSLMAVSAVVCWPGHHAGVNAADFTMVDLSSYYNGTLDKSWTTAYDGNNLAELGPGHHILKKTPFETDGVIQLQGAEWKHRGYAFPEKVEGIPVAARGRRIHLLHANSATADPPGTPVANLVLHYADGEQTDFPIRQGMEVLDWWDWPLAPDKRPAATNTFVAWTGSNPAARSQGARVRLFDTVFVNPHPEKVLKSIDYVSGMAGSAPFLVAITIEH